MFDLYMRPTLLVLLNIVNLTVGYRHFVITVKSHILTQIVSAASEKQIWMSDKSATNLKKWR